MTNDEGCMIKRFFQMLRECMRGPVKQTAPAAAAEVGGIGIESIGISSIGVD